MLKILHTSDSHWNDRGRLQDTVDMHRLMLQQAAEANVDLIVHAGDFFERRSTPTERTHLAEWLQAAAAIAPVYGVRGNHDAPGELEVFNRLETVHPIRIEDRVTSAPDSAWIVETGHGRPWIGCLGMAWIDKAHFSAGLDVTVDAEDGRQRTIAAVRDLLSCMRAEASRVRAAGAVPILVTHVMLGGSAASSGQILIGQGIDLSPSDLLDTGVEYAACGHIHVEQSFLGGRVAYSGNVTRHDMGEARDRKGYRLVTIDDGGQFVSSEFRELPARRIVLLEIDLVTEGLSGFERLKKISEEGDLRGARVRLRYRVRAEDLHRVDAVEAERCLIDAGAQEAEVEAVVETETRVRSAEIVTVQGTAAKVEAFWRAKQIDVDEPTRARVFGDLAELEVSA
jgi:exonuclease SbcD